MIELSTSDRAATNDEDDGVEAPTSVEKSSAEEGAKENSGNENENTAAEDDVATSAIDEESSDASEDGDNGESTSDSANEQPEETSFTDNDDQSYDAWNSNSEDDNSFWRKKRQASTAGDPKPLEVGIVHTKYGTVAMGPVLMGIAAGSEPQTAKVPLKFPCRSVAF